MKEVTVLEYYDIQELLETHFRPLYPNVRQLSIRPSEDCGTVMNGESKFSLFAGTEGDPEWDEQFREITSVGIETCSSDYYQICIDEFIVYLILNGFLEDKEYFVYYAW